MVPNELSTCARGAREITDQTPALVRDSRYRAGPSRDWIKVKNPKSPAMSRAKDAFA
jgi:hypothetical protein